MIFYHGTKEPPSKILKEGLQPLNIKKEGALLKEKYKIGSYITDRINDYIRRKRNYNYIYLTPDLEYAKLYAYRGSNFKGLVEMEICNMLNIKRRLNYQCKGGYVYVIKYPYKTNRMEIKVDRIEPDEIVDVIIN